MSGDLIEAIVYEGADPAEDPRWRLSGARTQEEYGQWCRHACGIACLQMVLHHRDGYARPLLDLLHACTAYGGYVEDGSGHVKGLIYAPFAAYVEAEHALQAEVHPHLTLDDIAARLAEGWLVMASVHREIRCPDEPAPGTGGHLVLVTGHADGTVHLCNPSGHTPDSRRAQLPEHVFAGFFAERGIALRPK
ncbi:C39 family peptidase [Nonomuraea sp. NPDC000554]|uniref:C39 family peptidase n=1 Tax=Nonomuraea sp. NPDC000554 TaxID=3154259 RepID=UPI003326A820